MKTIKLKFDTIGADAGPFTITDNNGNVLASNVSRSALLAGYTLDVDEAITSITATSTGDCTTAKTVAVDLSGGGGGSTCKTVRFSLDPNFAPCHNYKLSVTGGIGQATFEYYDCGTDTPQSTTLNDKEFATSCMSSLVGKAPIVTGGQGTIDKLSPCQAVGVLTVSYRDCGGVLRTANISDSNPEIDVCIQQGSQNYPEGILFTVLGDC